MVEKLNKNLIKVNKKFVKASETPKSATPPKILSNILFNFIVAVINCYNDN